MINLANILICVFVILMLTVTSNGAAVSQYMVYPSGKSVCESDEFLCSNGLCIIGDLICDGKPDCPLGDDEQSCPLKPLLLSTIKQTNSSSSNCSPAQFYQCQDSKKCIPWSQICDGKIQCLFGEDENRDNCASVPGFNSTKDQQKPQQLSSEPQPKSQQVDQILSSKKTTNSFSYGQWVSPSPSTYTPSSTPTWSSYSSSTVDYSNYVSNYGNNYTNENGTQDESKSTSVKTTKAVQSGDQSQNNFYQDQDEPGFVFVNFGPIISGDKNVNGNGNDIGNGNGNGNENGNGNGNGNGNNNNNKKDPPNDRGYRNDYSDGRAY